MKRPALPMRNGVAYIPEFCLSVKKELPLPDKIRQFWELQEKKKVFPDTLGKEILRVMREENLDMFCAIDCIWRKHCAIHGR